MIEDKLTDADYIAAGLTPPKREPEKPKYPAIKGWTPTIGRHIGSLDELHEAIVVLYSYSHYHDLTISPEERREQNQRRWEMVDAIAFEFLGGIPEGVEALT